MKTGMVKIFTLVFALALTTVVSIESSEAQEGAWQIGPRTLPAPNDVSDVMRESLLKTPTPDVEAARKIVPQTVEQWKAFIKERDAKAAAGAQALAKALSVSIEHEKIDGVNVYRVMPAEIDPKHKDHLFVYLHGGAYVMNGGKAGTTEAVLIASRAKMPVLSVDYRMPPDHPAPAAINDGIDRLLVTWDAGGAQGMLMYAGDYDLKHPHVSPVYGDFKGFPPSYLISGTRDLMLSDTVRVHRKLRSASVVADLHVYEGLSHGDYAAVPNSPESHEHYAELNTFLLKHLKR